MSRTSLDYQSLRADLRAESEATIRAVTSFHVLPTAERRENLLSLAGAVVAAGSSSYLTQHLAHVVSYYARSSDPMPAFGRLLCGVRDCDAVEVDAALERLCAA